MSGKPGSVLYYEPFLCGIVKLAEFGKSCYVYMVNGKNICRLFLQAVGRATALAQAFGECREGQAIQLAGKVFDDKWMHTQEKTR